MPHTFLLTGVNGQVGGSLLPLLEELGKVYAPTRAELDLSNADAIREYVRDIKPTWIINPAAYTAVDKAESEHEAAFAINATAPRVLGEEAAALGVPIIHFSTDYVFSGEGEEPFLPTSPTGPLGVYGASKLEGEEALLRTGATAFILRTSWVYGATGKNFLLTILRFAREREEMNIVADQFGAPTWSRDLARLAAHIVTLGDTLASQKDLSTAEALRPLAGIYHACNSGETTWFGFAQEFLRLAQIAEPTQRFAKLSPITTADYPTPAKRPHNSRLDCSLLRSKLEFEMPTWHVSLQEAMHELR